MVTALTTHFSTFLPWVISCARYSIINNPQQQSLREVTTELDLLQNSSSERIWTSASSKRSAGQCNSALSQVFLFATLRRFLSFSVIQISPHPGHLHSLLWNTSLNWSWGWEEHPAGTEKRSGGSETELVVPLFLAGWRGTVHLTASPSFSWRHEISSPLPHFCSCWHPSESTESHSFCVWIEALFSILALKHRNPKNLCMLWPPCYIYIFLFLNVHCSLDKFSVFLGKREQYLLCEEATRNLVTCTVTDSHERSLFSLTRPN